jgi:cell division septal protein FtsQ
MLFSKNKKEIDKRILPRNKIATGEVKNKVENQNPKFFSRFVFFLLAMVFLGVLAYVFLFSNFLEINKISITGIEELNYNDVLDYTESLYGGKILKIIPRNNFIFISTGKIESKLYDHFKKIGQVEVKKVFPNTLDINLIERKSILLWCSAGPCYFIDENGIAYQGADMDSDEVKGQNLVELSDQSGTPVTIGEKIFDPQSVVLISGIKDKIKSETDIDVTDQFETTSKMAEDFQAQTSDGTALIFSLTDDVDQQISNLKTFLEKEIEIDEIGKLEYIDLRAQDKVYYKIKDGETVTTVSGHQIQASQNSSNTQNNNQSNTSSNNN